VRVPATIRPSIGDRIPFFVVELMQQTHPEAHSDLPPKISHSLGDRLVAPDLHHCERFPGTTAHDVAIPKQNLVVQLGK
jgi:hypothetical protein